MPKYSPIIGIETHIQLNTKTKLFCYCLNEYLPDDPNKNICPFCTGQPGALPVLNKEAVKKAIKFGVAIDAKIPEKTRWDRKNYFYPDLPAGYQISQYDNPIVEGGVIEFYSENKNTGEFTKHKINLTRAHLEADAAKLLHIGGKTMVDFNRSCTPLLEIVTEPEIRTGEEAIGYVNELQLLVRTIEISDADMDKGQMRFDCNISLQTEEEKIANRLPKYKVEVKNINSARALGRAVESEIIRQTELLENNQLPAQETRGWRDDKNKSESQRSKEQADDYRYFPEPDLQILVIKPEDVPSINDLPKLPNQKRSLYLNLNLNLQIANTFVNRHEISDLFDSIIENSQFSNEEIKILANIITTNLISISEKTGNSVSSIISTENLIKLVKLFQTKQINNQGLQKIIELSIENPEKDVQEVATENNLIQVNDDNLLMEIVAKVIENNPKPVEEYKSGKQQVIGFLVGQCMKESKGAGNPQKFTELLKNKLGD